MKLRSTVKLMTVIGGWLAASCLHAAEFPAEQLEFFEKKIRPLLAENCLECHSTAAGKAKGELFLDHRDGFIKGGDAGTVVTLGQPEKSLFIKAVEYTDPELQMPPKRKLKAEQVADLKKWVQLGLPWPVEAAPQKTGKVEAFDLNKRKQSHWAWQPLKVVEPPKVKDAAWARTPIDRFILAKLEAERLKPAGPAEKRVLVRRLYFDLTGLPPAPEEVEAFVADASPDATQKLVKQLLASPQYGERWARHWLDMMRYAETCGHEFDYPIYNAWRYRDYVIRAFNADVPYNQFAKEHLAGDLLTQPRMNPQEGFNESVIGTGAFWLSQQVHSPVDIRMNQAELVDNQIDVITKTFLGMTVSCARCHDHKFDAISTKDYYSLYGIIESSRYRLAEVESTATTLGKAEQLLAIKRKIKERLRATTVPEDWKVKDYLLAVNEVIEGKNPSDKNKADAGDVLLADFEGKIFDGWKVTGEAFGEGPVTQKEIGSYQGDVGAVGKGFINSHNARRGGKVVQSDGLTGRLEGPEFTVGRKYIHFLVGGGAHEGKTCVNLLVDGKVVRTATGKNSNRMSPARFDVSEFIGKQAKIEVVDEVKGSWGNIGLDHVVMSDRTEFFGGDNQPLLHSDLIEAVAQARGLDVELLKRWIAVQTTKEEIHSPAELGSMPMTMDRMEFVTVHQKLNDGWTFPRNGWSANGAAFGIKATAGDAFQVGTLESPVKLLEEQTDFASGQVSSRLEGTLQSPTFVISYDYIDLLLAGKGSRVSLVMDGFTLIRYPIYGNLRQTLNSESPKWYRMDVRQWKGHRAYLEFVDRTPADPAANGGSAGDWFTVKQILFSNLSNVPAPYMRQTSWVAGWLEKLFRSERGTGVAEGGTRVASPDSEAEAIRAMVKKWLEGDVEYARQSRSINRLLANRLITLGRKDDAELREYLKEYTRIENSIVEPVTVVSMTEGTPFNEHVFLRGSPKRLGDEVPRRNLEALGGGSNTVYKSGSGRLQLAEDWTSPGNPLLARVIVNKVWHHLMGRGIVPTVDNFGVLGQKPTHPELLDWLTADFQNHGWSIKRLIETIVLTQAYQMSSQPMDAGAEQSDPNNVWWHRMNIKRLEAEAIRDTVLAVSGRLDKTMYGPSVPIHLTEFMDGRGRPSKSGPLDGDGRRSVYVIVRRNFLSPMMLAFDAPAPATTVGRRTVSNVPAQALIMMNDPFVVQQAKRWAETLLKDSNQTVEQRLTKIYATAFGRAMTAKEKIEALEFLKQQGAEYGLASESWQQDARVWADYCHVIFNVKEFVFAN